MNKEFTGYYAKEFQMLLDEKRSMGIKYRDEERQLYIIDKLTHNYDCTNGFPKELVTNYLHFNPNWAKATQRLRLNLMRQIALFLTKLEIPAYFADSPLKYNGERDFHPYIFSQQQIKDFFLYVDTHRNENHLKSADFRCLIYRLLYSSGLRISEALNLRMESVDFDKGTIFIKSSKNYKDRLLPIDIEILKLMKSYAYNYHKVYQAEDFFFQSAPDKAYSKCTVYAYYRKVLFEIGISHGGRKRGGPRLHDLRHTFCVHSFHRFLKNGISYESALPLLSAYMGHSSIRATAKYLHLTEEVFADITEKISINTEDIIPDIGEIPNEKR